MNIYKPKYILNILDSSFFSKTNYTWSYESTMGVIINNSKCIIDDYLIDIDLYEKEVKLTNEKYNFLNIDNRNINIKLLYIDNKNSFYIGDIECIKKYNYDKEFNLLSIEEYIIKKLLE